MFHSWLRVMVVEDGCMMVVRAGLGGILVGIGMEWNKVLSAFVANRSHRDTSLPITHRL